MHMRADALAEKPLSAERIAALESSSGLSLQLVVLNARRERLKPAPPGYPRRATWSYVPDFGVRFVEMSDDE